MNGGNKPSQLKCLFQHLNQSVFDLLLVYIPRQLLCGSDGFSLHSFPVIRTVLSLLMFSTSAFLPLCCLAAPSLFPPDFRRHVLSSSFLSLLNPHSFPTHPVLR